MCVLQLQRKRDSAIDLKRASLEQQKTRDEVDKEVTESDDVRKMMEENEKLHKELAKQETQLKAQVCLRMMFKILR